MFPSTLFPFQVLSGLLPLQKVQMLTHLKTVLIHQAYNRDPNRCQGKQKQSFN